VKLSDSGKQDSSQYSQNPTVAVGHRRNLATVAGRRHNQATSCWISFYIVDDFFVRAKCQKIFSIKLFFFEK
jgi:hypothetical protein